MKNKINTFVFPLLAVFPTNKAYGVTTELTVNALKTFGFKVHIIAPKTDQRKITVNSPINLSRKLYLILLPNQIKKFIQIRLTIFTILYAIRISVKFCNHSTVFWCRDLLLAYILTLTSKSIIVCEIHRRPSKVNKLYLHILKKNKRVLLAPISKKLQDDLYLDKNKSVIAPMSVSAKDIDFFSKVENRRKNKIIYVGNFISGPYKLNVNILNELSYRILSKHPDWAIQVVGISKSEFRDNCTRSLSTNLEIIDRLERREALKKLSESRIGLVIYPDEIYFHDSFPIKIVEYAAAKLSIIASDTVSHRNILSQEKCLYFKSGSLDSLESAVTKLISNYELQEFLSKNAFLWAKNLTYENRTKIVIDHLKTNYFS